MRLSRRLYPFDSDDFIFEIKFDGFRSLAFIEDGQCQLVSRNGHVFKNFSGLASAIAESLGGPISANRNVIDRNAIVDGEIVCLGSDGRSNFSDLLFRRAEPFFYAFDVLWLNGQDMRETPLIERKALLQGIVSRPKAKANGGYAAHRILYLDHIEREGRLLFERCCEMDLEGIVAKRKASRYVCDERTTSWIKIKNAGYGQAEGRAEMFENLKQAH